MSEAIFSFLDNLSRNIKDSLTAVTLQLISEWHSDVSHPKMNSYSALFVAFIDWRMRRYLDEQRICSAVWWNAYHPECVLNLDLIHSQHTDSLMSCATHPLSDSIMFFFFFPFSQINLCETCSTALTYLCIPIRDLCCRSRVHQRNTVVCRFISIISCLLKRCLGTLSMHKPRFFFLISFFVITD